MMLQTLQYGSEQIDYELTFAQRKSLGITVYPDCSIEVKAPMGSSLDKVSEKVRKKAPWILKQKSHFLSFEPRITPRKYISGETHLYLGRQYQLKVIESDIKQVKYTGRFIEVYSNSKKSTADLLNDWYRLKAVYWFYKIAEPIIERFKKYNVLPQKLEIVSMPHRWGSCSAKGRILLNPELIKAPKACIEYVIIHELCHLVHRDHTKSFFELQAREMPDWEKWKYKLEMLLA